MGFPFCIITSLIYVLLSVDPLLTVGTARQVLRIDNTDDRQTAAAGQH